MWDELKNIKSEKKELREFGLTIGIILVILSILALWRGKHILPYIPAAGVLFIILGFAIPKALLPFQKAWMAFSVILGFFMSRLILAILFYAVVTPIGLITRLFGMDILDQRMDRKKSSYWKKRQEETKEKSSYENQY